jgi:hypothetical protein
MQCICRTISTNSINIKIMVCTNNTGLWQWEIGKEKWEKRKGSAFDFSTLICKILDNLSINL